MSPTNQFNQSNGILSKRDHPAGGPSSSNLRNPSPLRGSTGHKPLGIYQDARGHVSGTGFSFTGEFADPYARPGNSRRGVDSPVPPALQLPQESPMAAIQVQRDSNPNPLGHDWNRNVGLEAPASNVNLGGQQGYALQSAPSNGRISPASPGAGYQGPNGSRGSAPLVEAVAVGSDRQMGGPGSARKGIIGPSSASALRRSSTKRVWNMGAVAMRALLVLLLPFALAKYGAEKLWIIIKELFAGTASWALRRSTSSGLSVAARQSRSAGGSVRTMAPGVNGASGRQPRFSPVPEDSLRGTWLSKRMTQLLSIRGKYFVNIHGACVSEYAGRTRVMLLMDNVEGGSLERLIFNTIIDMSLELRLTLLLQIAEVS